MRDYDFKTIFERQSIRKYDMAPLSESILESINARIGRLTPLFPDIPVHIAVIPASGMGQLFAVAAPHYLVGYIQPGPGALENIGFMMEQMDLFFSTNGLGSCWLGKAKPHSSATDPQGLRFAISLAFGRPSVPLHRSNIAEFDRKPLRYITPLTEGTTLLEAVRFAPSTMNGQPWYSTGDASVLHAYCSQAGVIRNLALKQLNRVDMGISLCYLWVADGHAGRQPVFYQDDAAAAQPPKDCKYVLSARL